MAKPRTEIAFFTRNHPEYLDEAVAMPADRLVTFRAVTRWVRAAQALHERTPRALYIAQIGDEGTVKFVAELWMVQLDPKIGQPTTDELLSHQLESTRGEGLWEKDKFGKAAVGTLYAIKRCRRLVDPFSMTELVKISNHQRLSADYGYSYSIVYARECR